MPDDRNNLDELADDILANADTVNDGDDDEGGRTRPFADVLLELNKGRTHTELSNALQALVMGVRSTGKKGSVTLTIQIIPSKSEAPFEVVDNVVLKLPAATRRASLFYVDDDDNLVRKDPNQMQLPLRDIGAEGRRDRGDNR